jgi:hypothetical protein
MKIFLTLCLALVACPALAQQQPASTVQQLMSNDANIKATLATLLDQANAKIATDEAEIKRLKDKYEPAKADEPKKP